MYCSSLPGSPGIWTESGWTRSTQHDAGDLGYLHPCRDVLHDRDTKFCVSFRTALASGGVKTIQLPAKSPNLNAFAERRVRSVKQECLSKLILLGESSLSRVLSESRRLPGTSLKVSDSATRCQAAKCLADF